MALTKAIIEILDQDKDTISVQFNPTEYTRTKGAQIAEINIPGLDSPILQFIRGQNEKLSMELFFDTTREGMGEDEFEDVRVYTEPLYQLVKIQSETHAPPRVRFIWGEEKENAFQAIVESVQQKFTLFNPAGVPLRATLSVTFREYKTLEEQIRELNLQSADHSKRRTVQRGDTLSHIAAEEYDDPGAWRAIAEANDIVNPRKLKPGTVLRIPPLDIFSQPIVA
jgi:nucleoid-associated protein YgaU